MLAQIFLAALALLLGNGIMTSFLQNETRKLGNTAPFVVKFDPVGQIVNSTAQASITDVSTDAGSIFTVGQTGSGSDGLNSLIRRSNSDGSQVSVTSAGGQLTEEYSDIVPRANGGYQAIGCSNAQDEANMQVVLSNMNGNAQIESSILIGTPQQDVGAVLTNTPNGNTVIGGWVKQIHNTTTGNQDSVVIQMDQNNQIVSATQFGNETQNDQVRDIASHSNGSITTVSYVATPDPSSFYSRFDSSLNHQWSKDFDIDGYNSTRLNSLYPLSTNQEFMVGGHARKSGGQDAFLGKVDSNGNFVWGKTYSHNQVNLEGITAINPTSSGGILIAGYTKIKYALLAKLDADGNLQWVKTWQRHFHAHFNQIYELQDGNIHAVGHFCESLKCNVNTGFVAMFDADGNGPDGDYQTSPITNLDTVDVTNQIQVNTLSLTPSPYTGLTITPHTFPTRAISFEAVNPPVVPPYQGNNQSQNQDDWIIPVSIVCSVVAVGVIVIIVLLSCWKCRKNKAKRERPTNNDGDKSALKGGATYICNEGKYLEKEQFSEDGSSNKKESTPSNQAQSSDRHDLKDKKEKE